MNKYLILLSFIVLSCSVDDSSHENNKETVWDSVKIPIFTYDSALIPICNQVIKDESTCEYYKDRRVIFALTIAEENDTCDIYIELIDKNSINKIKKAGCFVYKHKLFIVDTSMKHVDIFNSSGDSILFFTEINTKPDYVLIDDRGSFWNYKLFNDSVKLEYKSICNY